MALSLDGITIGANTGAGSPNPITTTGVGGNLVTANAGDIVVVAIFLESLNSEATYPAVSAVSVGGSAATLRNRFQYQGNAKYGGGGAAFNDMEIWWYYAAATLNAAVTVTATNWDDCCAFYAFGVTGFTGTIYHTSPWDQSAVTAAAFTASQASSATTQTQLVTGSNISTVDAATMVLAFGGSSDDSATVPFNSAYATGPIAGTTATDSGEGNVGGGGTNAAWIALEYRVLSSTISAASAAFGAGATAGAWGIMVDALSQTGDPIGTFFHSDFEPVPSMQRVVTFSESDLREDYNPAFARQLAAGQLPRMIGYP